MRIFLLLVLVSVCALVNGQKIIHIDTSENRYVSPKGYRNPELMFKNFSATTYNGIPYTTDSLKGKTTFVNFWYEGCLPCLAEFDALNDLYDLYKNNPLFQFLSFTSESKENALRVADKFKLKYPVICIEKDNIYNMIFNLGFPTSLIIDKNEKIRFIVCGGFSDQENAKRRIDSIFINELDNILNEQTQ